MKLKLVALSMALMMAVALAGCSANRDRDDNSAAPVNSAASDYDVLPSNGMNNGDAGARYSQYDQDNVSGSTQRPSDGDNVMDDIGDAAGDMARGAGNVVRDAGDAIGDAANDVGRAMR